MNARSVLFASHFDDSVSHLAQWRFFCVNIPDSHAKTQPPTTQGCSLALRFFLNSCGGTNVASGGLVLIIVLELLVAVELAVFPLQVSDHRPDSGGSLCAGHPTLYKGPWTLLLKGSGTCNPRGSWRSKTQWNNWTTICPIVAQLCMQWKTYPQLSNNAETKTRDWVKTEAMERKVCVVLYTVLAQRLGSWAMMWKWYSFINAVETEISAQYELQVQTAPMLPLQTPKWHNVVPTCNKDASRIKIIVLMDLDLKS